MTDIVGDGKPVVVSANAGLIDGLQSVARLLLVLATSLPILLQLIGARDVVALVAYFQGEQGASLVAAIVGIATMAYGVFKSRKRGAQIATVAADRRVPDAVASIK